MRTVLEDHPTPGMPLQLSELIKRLNAGELEELLARHGIPDEISDPARISAMLVERRHLNSIITELNQPEILIIRWLAEQDNFQASWDAFIDALDGRIPDEQLQHYLNDLRLFGLVDYVAQRGSGWIATYPAVAAAQPISQGIDLNSALNGLSAEMLLGMCQKLSVKPIPTTKAKRIESITRCLSDHNFLVFLIASLPSGSMELFEWLLARGGTADHNALAAKLGESYYSTISYVTRVLTGWGATNAAKASPFIDLLERGLVAGVSAYGHSWGYASYFAIPAEVSRAYAGTTVFDSAPLTPPPLAAASPTNTRLPNMTTLLRDLSHLRAFVSLGRAEWRQDGGPYARSLQTLNKLISGPTKDYGSVLWKAATDIPVVVSSGDHDGGYMAADLSGTRPDDLIRSLIEGWSQERVSGYYGDQELPRDTHRRVLALLPTLPRDVWLERDSLESFLAFCWPLVFNAKVKSANQRISGDWTTLYATVLGQGFDKDGHESFLVQSAGMDIVFAQEAAPSLELPDWDSTWIVQPDRTIMVPPNAHPDSILDLWCVADLIENQGASIFRVSADSIIAALNHGMTPQEITALFDRHSRTAMPATIERIIRDQSQRYGQVRVGRASSYLEVDDPQVLDEIVRNAKLSKLKIQAIAPTVAVVQGVDDATIIANLRRSGYLPTSANLPGRQETPALPTRPGQSENEIKTLLKRAVNDQRLVSIQWRDPVHGALERVIEPERLRNWVLTGYDAETNAMVDISQTIITSVRILTSKESRKYIV
ncbi:MAG TPA: helicase-associated domain-containing protein [Chloroflexota bacterium]|nr:helicase-associated domain-containing protein [Chloroflexota bacterium]